jgi:DNA-binding NarL/FixJ family response regulator
LQSEYTFIIIDDHPTFRSGLRATLEKDGRFNCLGEGGTVKEMCRLIREKRPVLSVVDIALGEESGFEVFSCRGREGEQPAVLFISMFIKAHYVVKAISLGGRGYVVKDSPQEVIYRAAESVAEGHHFFDSAASDALADWMRSVPHAGEMVQDGRYNSLSEREKEIFFLLAEGGDTATIAKKLFISRKTVMNYRNSILRTLELENTFELKAYAEDMGLV